MKTVYALFFIIITNNLFAQAPANNECAGAIQINRVLYGVSCSSSISANTDGATQSLPNPICTRAENDDDIWHRSTPATSTIGVQFSNAVSNTTGNEAIIGIAVYATGCPSSRENELKEFDIRQSYEGSTFNSVLRLQVIVIYPTGTINYCTGLQMR